MTLMSDPILFLTQEGWNVFCWIFLHIKEVHRPLVVQTVMHVELVVAFATIL